MAAATLEDTLIRNLITRLYSQLNFNNSGIKSQDQIQQEVLRKKNEKTLIHLCAGKLNFVAGGLVETLDALIKSPTTTEEASIKVAQSQLHVLDLLEKCFIYQWDHIKAQFRTVEGLDEKEKIRLKEKEEQILPPSLEDTIAITLLRHICFFTHKTQPHLQAELRERAGRVLFQLSASNYETVISTISSQINSPPGNTDEELCLPFLLIEYLNLNSRRLSELLEKLNKASPTFKKAAVQVTLARVLRRAIWNWIDNYPMEFVALCQTGTRLAGGPDTLFDTFDNWASSSTSKKGHFWPLQTMLLILCPDIMLKVAISEGKSKSQDNKEKFLESLKKALKSGKLTDVAAICYVDICKASTFVSKGDTSALRYIVPGIETELKEKLFNPAQPFKNSDGIVDQQLMVDCMLSYFLLSPRKVINSLFLECVKQDSPPLFKIVLVKCLLKLAQVGKAHLPWNPTIADVYTSHPANLRSIFHDYEAKLSQGQLMLQAASSSDKKAKLQNEKIIMDVDILTKLIQLFNVDAVLALYQLPQKADDIDDIKKLLTGLCNCASYFAIPELAETAGKALLELHKPVHIERWNPKNTMKAFWVISAAVNSALAELLIKGEVKVHQIQKIANLLQEILLRRNEFLAKRYKDERSEVGSTDLRNESAAKLEVALLMQLCSPEPDICSKCARCFGLLCDEADILSRIDDVDNPIVANYSVYKELATTGQLSTGQAAQQKSIRTLLRRIDRQTQGNYRAWQEVYARWNIYTAAVLTASDDSKAGQRTPHKENLKRKFSAIQMPRYVLEKTSTEVFQEWTNYCGFLCALSGVCLISKVPTKPMPRTAQGTVEEFIQELVELVISENVNVRETAKMLLGNSLSPAAYSVLFHHLHQEVKKFFGESGQVSFSDTATLFVDQVISIAKLIFEMDHTAGELSLSSDFEDLALLLVKYVRQLVMTVGSLQSKIKLCGLLESMMERRQYVSFRDEFKFRQNLVENILEWTSEFAAKEQNITEKQLQKLIKDLDHQALKTIASLLHKLPLQGDDNEAKAKSFSKYFTFFTRLLTRCRKDPTAFMPGFAEVTILVLSNLVSANIDHGLEYFVTMGYHEDFETRSAFLKVLANILNQGAEFDAASDDNTDKYYRLVELLLDPELEVVMALCDATQITEADEVAQLLTRLFEANERTMDLLKSSILLEVMKTEHATTLFRRNSMATKLLAAYSKLIGQKYLQDTLCPYLNHLMSAKLSFEVDPTKLLPNEDVAKNAKNVLDVSQRFLDDIKKSLSICPKPFREICNFMRKVVEERFPDCAHTAIGGFMFLRFFCPALVAPEGFGLIQGVLTDKNLRRGLVLVTKVLQNLANKVQFTKEEYMRGMNDFINGNMNAIVKLFEEFAVIPPNSPPAPTINFSDEQKEEDLGRLHYHLSRNMEKISRILSTNRTTDDSKGRSSTLDRLKNLLAQLGPPPEPNKNANLARKTAASKDEGTSAPFEKFMKNLAHRNTDSIKEKNIFYQQGFTKDKLPVFYFIARNFKQDVDPELIIYYVLKTMQPFFNKPFAIVVDCTLFGSEHQLSYAWCATFNKLIPPVVTKNLDAVYFINPNTWFKKYCKRVGKLVARLHKKFVFLPNVKKLFESIPESECGLPAYTLSVEDVKATFVGISKVAQIKKEVGVRISNDLLQITSTKLYNVLGCNTALIDLFHISRIHEISTAPSDEGSVIIKYEWNGQKSMTLRADPERAVQLVQQLKASQDRYKLTKPSKLESERTFRPSDVPGTLLNMALLNLTNTTHSLRAAAYNLLCALCNTFSFSVHSQLLEANEICIPRDSSDFVIKLSKQLAASEPKLTLEFLLEAIHGIAKCDKNARHQCLAYIKPWIPNLRLFCRPSTVTEVNEKFLKTKEIINSFITLTLREGPEIGPAIQNMIWKRIGRVSELLDLVLELFLERIYETKSAIGSKTLDAIEDMSVAVASQNAELVSGKLISRVILKLGVAADAAKDVMHNPDYWNSITAHFRLLLMLSFDNTIRVESYLPELFHIITLSFATGSSIVRATIHSLLINIVHSLYTSIASNPTKEYDADTLHRLRFHLSEFQQIKFRLLFGIGATNITPFSKVNTVGEKLETMPLLSVETVATALLAVLNCTAQNNNAIGTGHHARWLSLITAAAFTYNSAHQPRAFVALGVVCRSPKYVTEDLVQQVLIALVVALRKGIGFKTDDLPISILKCLTHLFENLSPSSKYFKQMFWIAMTIVQIGDLELFLAAVPFIEVILKVLDENGCFKQQGLSTYLTSNLGPLEPLLSKLDQLTGINYKTNFSFAVACHMLKGLRHATAKPVTARCLTTFLDIAVKENVGPNLLGYVAALLTVKGDELSTLKQILIPPGVDPSGTSQYHFLFNDQMLPDATSAGLLFSFLVTVLKNCDVEHEQLTIYEAFKDGVQMMPEAFPVTYDILVPKIQQAIITSHNPEIIDAVMAITKAMFSYEIESASSDRMKQGFLTRVGFAGMPSCDQFPLPAASLTSSASSLKTPSKKENITKIVCSIVEGIVGKEITL